ncbi:hypothetical protein KLA_13594 [Cellulophaga geojensis KL-A]|uniref:Uncharacterized protein n=2 Tax=Cellulophaga TaxID=104264 RepID=F0RDE4_CELLC|nr:hypothetical protein Celly_3069 [Cellulophaga lytica DSM 7489]APU11774.1 acetyltransferase [Cellulophaga lytica]EWH12652.1 hypothetical protein KLA_13594 [Cellulophaga geojensis KL-A]TVZ09784.1 hypothetical protein JM80_2315 [Cellulophaga sp. RHA_52]
MFYIITTILTIIIVIALGMFKKYATLHPKKYLITVSAIGLVVSLILGLLIGTAYSHGIDISWWVFSVLFFIMIIIPCLILVGLAQLKLKIKKHKNHKKKI